MMTIAMTHLMLVIVFGATLNLVALAVPARNVVQLRSQKLNAWGQTQSLGLFQPHASELPNTLDLSARIVGGGPAKPHEFTFMASFQKGLITAHGMVYYSHVCGGSLITPTIILTAAHCLGSFNRIVLGRYNLRSPVEGKTAEVVEATASSDSSAGRLVFQATEVKVIKHPRYTFDLYRKEISMDFALIVLPSHAHTKTAFSEPLMPVRLNANPNIPSRAGEPLIVCGWGATADPLPNDNFLSTVIKATTVGYVPNNSCAQSGGYLNGRYYSFWGFIKPNMMCALTPDQDACNGDSGGPLLLTDGNKGNFIQVGVVSFGVEVSGLIYQYRPTAPCQWHHPIIIIVTLYIMLHDLV